MKWKSPEPARLHEMATHFREFAHETRYPDYIRMMTRTADDLDSLAAGIEGDPSLARAADGARGQPAG